MEFPAGTDEKPFTVCSEPGWLVAAFDRPQRLLSWSINRPSFQQARRVAWLQVVVSREVV